MSTFEPYICFSIENYEEIYQRDPEALQKLESALANIGAIPGEVSEPKRVFCVSITNLNLNTQVILDTFSGFGYRAKSLDGPIE